VYITLPVPLKPYLGLRVIGQKVFGAFPFHEAAFIGGRAGIRSLDPQRYAGDAAVTSKLELRVPVLKISFILPLEVGLFAAQEVGRVYVDGESPDGWHNTFGAGVWVAFTDISISFRFIERNEVGRDAEPALRVGTSVELP
jgi:hemolysin activation/secretion protein